MNKNTNEISESFAPFTANFPEKLTYPIILTSPHSGRFYSEDFLSLSQLTKSQLRQFEDTYIDELIDFSNKLGISNICGNYARSYIDLNRDTESLDPLLFANFKNNKQCANTKLGFGIIPRNITQDAQIYKSKINLDDGLARINKIHTPYHHAINDEIIRIKNQFGMAILIDCHSMPQKAIGNEKIDIIIGDKFGTSIEQIYSDNLAANLRNAGYIIKKNYIYSGGYTTKTYGNPKNNVNAIQIEINRSLYINEMTLEKTNGFDILKANIEKSIMGFIADL